MPYKISIDQIRKRITAVLGDTVEIIEASYQMFTKEADFIYTANSKKFTSVVRDVCCGSVPFYVKNPFSSQFLSKYWHSTKNGDITPKDVSASSEKLYWFFCDKGCPDYKACPYNKSKRHDCIYCSGNKVCDKNSLLTLFPKIADEWHLIKNLDLSPNNILAKSEKKVWWKCKRCGNEWRSVVSSRTISGNGCNSFGCIENKIKQTSIKNWGVDRPSKSKEVQRKIVLRQHNKTIIFHWKTNEELVCQASYESKVVKYLNKNKIDFEWQIPFDMPNGRRYFVDLYLKEQSLWVEIKGYFRKDAREKWDWFHKEHPNSELWNQQKLKEMRVL